MSNYIFSFIWQRVTIIRLITFIIVFAFSACVPGLYYIGTDSSVPNHQFHVMVMDLLGKSLEDLFQECRRKFDLKTVLHISVQMVSAIILKLCSAHSVSTQALRC